MKGAEFRVTGLELRGKGTDLDSRQKIDPREKTLLVWHQELIDEI